MVNTGFESPGPELVLPEATAQRLEIGRRPKGARRVPYVAVAGRKLSLLRLPTSVEVVLLAGDREKDPVGASALVTRGETEVLLSDKLAGALAIAIEDAGEGLWRLREEPPERARKSEPPEEW